MCAYMDATVADERAHGNWDYVFSRPMPVPPLYSAGGHQHVNGDCSKGCQYITRWGGGPDPMHNGWDVWGNSTTIFMQLDHVTLAEAEPGDIITFGFWAGEHHACMLRRKNGPGLYDWIVWNFGSDGEPSFRTLQQEIAGHAGMTVTVCKLDLPVDPPAPPIKLTPEQKLQRKTGWYSWVAWKLGEGQWKHYGKANKRVRPNVPKRIPASWWVRLARFLKNRKTGNPRS